jgi:hypothetical protein
MSTDFLINQFSARKRFFMKPTVVLVVILMSAYFGRNANPTTTATLALLVVSSIALIILMDKPLLGLLGIIIVSLNVKYQIPTGTNVPLNFTIVLSILLIGLWVIRMIMNQDVRLTPSSTTRPALLFALATTVSLIGGNVTWIFNAPEKANMPAQIGGWLLYVLPIGVFLLVANQVKDLVWLRRITYLFIGLGGLYILTRVFGLTPIRDAMFVSIRSLGAVFWIWLVALAYGQAVLNTDLKPILRIIFGMVVFLTFFVAITTSFDWNSGWLPGLIAIGVITWLASNRMRIAFIALSAIVTIVIFEPMYQYIDYTIQHHTIVSRQATYPILIELIKANPVIGLGMSNYYHFTPLYPILGWYVKFNSHNNFIDIIAQTGLVGMGLFAWFAYEIGRVGWRLRHKVTDGFSRGYVYACLGGLVATLISGFIGDWFLPFTYNIGMTGFRAAVLAWLFLGGLIAIEQLEKAKEPKVEVKSNEI